MSTLSKVCAVILVLLSQAKALASGPAYDPARATLRRCTAAVILATAANDRAHADSIRALADAKKNVTLATSGSRVRLSAGAVSFDTMAPAVAAATSCANAEQRETLSANAVTMPATYVQAVAAAEAVRTSAAHRGPVVDLSKPDSEIYTSTYNDRYILVIFVGRMTVENGHYSLGCSNEEFYRYDPRTSQAVQYDGCVEGRTPALPRFSDLPV